MNKPIVNTKIHFRNGISKELAREYIHENITPPIVASSKFKLAVKFGKKRVLLSMRTEPLIQMVEGNEIVTTVWK
jgi:hypothetical protein